MGVFEATAVAGAFLALAATAWLPSRALRVVGGAWAAAGLVVALRPVLGFAPAALLAVALGALGAWRLPEVVLRRIAFALPSLLLLTYVTAVLMYLAPGSPFANERARPEERTSQLQTLL